MATCRAVCSASGPCSARPRTGLPVAQTGLRRVLRRVCGSRAAGDELGGVPGLRCPGVVGDEIAGVDGYHTSERPLDPLCPFWSLGIRPVQPVRLERGRGVTTACCLVACQTELKKVQFHSETGETRAAMASWWPGWKL